MVTLIEVAEGVDPQTDVIAHMGFEPAVVPEPVTMDKRVFSEGPMGIGAAFGGSQ